jgi:hypothetical protein
MDCPKARDCPLLSPLMFDAARSYLASRYCQGDYWECLRQQRVRAAVAEAASQQQSPAPAAAQPPRLRLVR